MQIKSRVFGEIEISENKIISFGKGLMGFEDNSRYALLYDSEKQNGKGVMWLQSMEDANLAFPVIDPLDILSEYKPMVEDEWLANIGEYGSDEELLILCVLTVPADLTQMTANIKAPLVINTVTRKGCQIIVNNDDYEVRYNVYDYIQKLKKGGR